MQTLIIVKYKLMVVFVLNVEMVIHLLLIKKVVYLIQFMIEIANSLKRVLNVVYVKSDIILKVIYAFHVIQINNHV